MELLKLDDERKWRYLRLYYELASAFYDFHDEVVTDAEIEARISKLKSKPRPRIRKEYMLSEWAFKLDMDNRGIRDGYFAGGYGEAGWNKVRIPHAFGDVPADPVKFGRTDNNMYASEAKEGEYCDIWRGDSHAWYKCRLSLDELRDDEIAYLGFDSVNLLSDVWVNDYPVMTDHLGLFPYRMEITDELKAFYSRTPVIAVRVTNIASNIPNMFYNGFQFDYSDAPKCSGRHGMDWKGDSSAGIAGAAVLSILNKNHVESAFLSTTVISGDGASVTAEIQLRNDSWAPFQGSIAIELSEWLPEESGVVFRDTTNAMTLPMNESKLRIRMQLDHCKPWTVECPCLYLAHFTLYSAAGKAIDDLYETFGVRTIEMKGSHLYLNGRKFVPQGTHDVCHYYGEPQICPSDRIIVKDMLLHKKMGANCSRWPSDSRMHYERIAEYCDQFGFLLSWTGFFEIWNIHAEAEMYVTRDVKAMIRSLRNHPSIIVWEMGDEVLNCSHESRRIRWFGLMYDLVAAEDSSRPIIPAGAWVTDLVRSIKESPEKNLPMKERRRRVLERLPVFDRKLALWDYHDCPIIPPFNPITWRLDDVRDTLEGQKPVIFTEFGIDAMPDPASVMNVYGKFRWDANPFYIIRKKTMDIGAYGRELTEADWRETQAFQALICAAIIDRLRQSPEAYAGYYFVTMFDVWTFFWGAVDANGHCKLSYFAIQNYFSPVCVTSLHGNVTVRRSDGLKVSLSNYGDHISGAHLEVVIKDEGGKVLHDADVAGVMAKGGVAVTEIARIAVDHLPAGLYSIEYYLKTKERTLITKTIELAYFE